MKFITLETYFRWLKLHFYQLYKRKNSICLEAEGKERNYNRPMNLAIYWNRIIFKILNFSSSMMNAIEKKSNY